MAPTTLSTTTPLSPLSHIDIDTNILAVKPKSFEGPIHIATSIDGNDVQAIPTMLNSIKQHHSNKLIVHVLVDPDNAPQLKLLIKCCKIDEGLEVYLNSKFNLHACIIVLDPSTG